ncbi:MAG: class I SAM-dependent methyltransferase [Flavobacteriaceae bacterium]|nr:class I SAM-dependent methyltransferase [Flavobacteriaceae bacterium]
MKQINKSPINNNELKPYITCIDYTVSRETFSIFIDKESELLVTTPRPKDKDLGKYYESEDYISHSNSKKSLLNKVYQIVRSYTIKQKIKLINSFNETDKKILDIGTGTGDFLVACKNSGWIVNGVEPNKDARVLANTKLQIDNHKIYKDVEELKLHSCHLERSRETALSTYDVITMWHVLEHVPNLTEYVSNLKQLLKPNGTLIIAVPNYKSFDAVHYKEYWAAFDVPRHLWHFSKTAIQKLFQQENMKVVKTLPMKFDSYYVSLLSEKYKTGNSNLLKSFFIGFKSNWKARASKEYSSIIYIIKNS